MFGLYLAALVIIILLMHMLQWDKNSVFVKCILYSCPFCEWMNEWLEYGLHEHKPLANESMFYWIELCMYKQFFITHIYKQQPVQPICKSLHGLWSTKYLSLSGKTLMILVYVHFYWEKHTIVNHCCIISENYCFYIIFLLSCDSKYHVQSKADITI